MPSKKTKFYNMVSGNEIFIFDEIGFWGTDAQGFVSDLNAIKEDSVTVRIMSPGGSVIDALAMYDILRNSAKTVDVVVNFAASAASIIAMAGDTVSISENGYFLIHRPTVDTFGGNSDDLRKNASILDEITERLVLIYAEKTGMDREEIKRMVDEETMINAEQAVQMGFADSVTEAAKEAAKIPLSFLSKLENQKVKKMTKEVKNEEVVEETAAEEVVENLDTEIVEDVTEEEAEETTEEVEEVEEVVNEDDTKEQLSALAATVSALKNTVESLVEQLSASATPQNRSGFRTPQNTIQKIGFMAQVKRIQKDEGLCYNDALASAIAKFPKAHAEFLKEQTKKATK